MLKILATLTLLFVTTTIKATIDTKNVIKVSATTYQDKASNKFLVVTFKNQPGWHTYWKNPGDAGIATKISFTSGSSTLKLNSIPWPSPKRYIAEGNIWTYGYAGKYSIFYPLSKLNYTKVNHTSFKIKATWLACKKICIPGQSEFKLSDTQSFTTTKEEISQHLSALPRPTTFPQNLKLVLALSQDKKGLALYYSIPNLEKSELGPDMNLITPYLQEPFSFKHETLISSKTKTTYAHMDIEWDGEYMEPEEPLPTDGKFKKPYTLKFLYSNPSTSKVEIIEKTFSTFLINGQKALESVTANKKKKSSATLWYYLILAFLGGLILNIMPCVLPVISIKLFSIIKHSNSKEKLFMHSICYTSGILFTFILLGSTIIILKKSGEIVGWGFQLQSPIIVSIMIMTMFIFALNLFGLYEFKTPGGKFLGGLQISHGMLGDFISGIMATILSTPCSAPFLGVALTFALTSTSYTIIGTFMAIGLGLSFPFILIGIFPGLISFLPKPGMWMENLRKFLGLSLIFTALWLTDVFLALTENSNSLLVLNCSMALMFFAFYFYNSISKKLIYFFTFFILSTALFVANIAFNYTTLPSSNDSSKQSIMNMNGMTWEKWSEEKLLYYKNRKELVFIDFTARWCLTCKVNEKLVLDTAGFKELVKKHNMKLLLADWTKRDPVIGKWLKDHGMVGVPAYFIQTPNGRLINLGETLTISKIKSNL